MTSKELAPTPAYLQRVRLKYPGAIGIGSASGFRHQVLGEIKRMEKSGEIVARRRFAKLDERTGIYTVPYVRLREVGAVRRAARARRAGIVFSAGAFLSLVGWLIWESREILMTFAAFGVALALAAKLWPHWVSGCPGLHCKGCGG